MKGRMPINVTLHGLMNMASNAEDILNDNYFDTTIEVELDDSRVRSAISSIEMVETRKDVPLSKHTKVFYPSIKNYMLYTAHYMKPKFKEQPILWLLNITYRHILERRGGI